MSNVQLHSTKSLATILLQSYGTSIKFVIGDDGIGIKEGLKSAGENLTDKDAIELSLKPGITGRSDKGGMGLTEIVEYVIKYNDKMCIRSRKGYCIFENTTFRKGECSDLPGTQIYFHLQCV